MKDLLEQYYDLRSKIQAFAFASYLISWDSETEAPAGCFEERSKQVGILSKMRLDLLQSDQTFQLVETLFQAKDQLDSLLQVEINKLYKQLTKSRKVPKDLLIGLSVITSKANSIWAKAKTNNDFALFKPVLEQIVDYKRKYMQYIETPELKGYDALLDEYEEGFTIEKYDLFFNKLKTDLVPFVKKIASLAFKHNDDFATKKYSIDKQRKLTNYLMDVLCFDQNYGIVKESEHPFTSGFGTKDVRITTHYHEKMLTSSIFSVIHELGHATYELQSDPSLDGTMLGGGTSMAMHESQSRFYENIIGRNLVFWQTHFPFLQKLFKKQLAGVSSKDFFYHVNKVELSLVRIEADELTYPLHIMVRYELEKALMAHQISVNDLPKQWNRLYKEYLGVNVPNDRLGVLQDVHWAGGSFGYFPTYALGSAYAAQLYYYMQKDLDINEIIRSGNLKAINEWLKDKVHKYGATKTPDQIMMLATNEEFNPQYYIDYLKNKYRQIYQID